MTKALAVVFGILAAAAPAAYPQTPTGAITGTVKDASGAVIPKAQVSIVNTATLQSRDQATSDDGLFTTAALAPGSYRITVVTPGFKRSERDVTVAAGTTAIIEVSLDPGDVTETISVTGALPLIRRDHHQVGGVIAREQIDRIPLNGRSFLELAKLEPGVIPARLADGRTFVSSLGAGVQTVPRVGAARVTVDGVNITTPGTAGVLLQVSPDVVQEFHIATVNFDAATSLTSNGAINIVTRSGTSAYRGGGFYFFRDDHLAAYPSLRRDPANLDPPFERHQFGFSSGGPLWKRRLFFFGSFERTDQTGVISVRPLEEFAALGGLFPSPYTGNQTNVRVDAAVHPNHTVFARYSADRNLAFINSGPGPLGLPSSWAERVNDSTQTLAGMTNVISDRAVNELRVSHFQAGIPLTLATSRECPGCFGLGEIRTVVSDANLTYGGQGRSSDASAWRFQLTDGATWQLSGHTLRAGFDWEHTEATNFSFGTQANEISLFSPREARQTVPGLAVPVQFVTPEDILALPIRNFSITVGSGSVLWDGFRPERVTDLYRLYAADSWRATDRLTLNVGLSWSYEPNVISQDFAKPALLAPILGSDGLNPPKPEKDNVSTTFGLAWAATADGRTVVRGGAGRYFDPLSSTNTLNRIRERDLLLPLGTGSMLTASMQFQQATFFTGAQLIASIPTIRENLLRSLNPGNRDLSVRNLDFTKTGTNLVDRAYVTPSSVHLSLGVQREVARGLLVSADVAWKRFDNTFINGIDFNRWFSAGGPVIPRCTTSQRNDVSVACSNGPMFFDTTSGRARYRGLLLRTEKHFGGRGQLLASYALASFVGNNGTGTGTSENAGGRVFGFNNDNWDENYGPLPSDQRHVLNVAGAIELPLDFSLAVSVSAYSAPPFAPYVANVDFNGDGTGNAVPGAATGDLLPGTTINQFGRGLDKDDLIRLVQDYNANVSGTRTAGGQIAPVIQLPERFSFNDSFFTQDLRLTRRFSLGAARGRVEVSLDVFNLFNTSNLVGYGSDLTRPALFGQPGDRVGQAFGSGGSRAIQLGARLQF